MQGGQNLVRFGDTGVCLGGRRKDDKDGGNVLLQVRGGQVVLQQEPFDALVGGRVLGRGGLEPEGANLDVFRVERRLAGRLVADLAAGDSRALQKTLTQALVRDPGQRVVIDGQQRIFRENEFLVIRNVLILIRRAGRSAGGP